MSTENVLQGILSQKIVQSGGVYSAKTDVVNVDTIKLDSTSTQAGSVTTNVSGQAIVQNALITANCVVVVTPTENPGGYYWVTSNPFIAAVATPTPADAIPARFIINVSPASAKTFNYYIAKY
jgi:hypothetical protein